MVNAGNKSERLRMIRRKLEAYQRQVESENEMKMHAAEMNRRNSIRYQEMNKIIQRIQKYTLYATGYTMLAMGITHYFDERRGRLIQHILNSKDMLEIHHYLDEEHRREMKYTMLAMGITHYFDERRGRLIQISHYFDEERRREMKISHYFDEERRREMKHNLNSMDMLENILNAMEINHYLDKEHRREMQHNLNSMEDKLNYMEKYHDLDKEHRRKIQGILNAMERTYSEMELLDKHFKKEQEKRQKDCDIYICLFDRKDHRVHYVPIDVFMNINLPPHQQKTENEDNPMSKGKKNVHRFSCTISSYSPFEKEIHIVWWNGPIETKCSEILVERITETEEFQQGQDIMQNANQHFKELLAEFDEMDVRRTLHVNEKELQSSAFDYQCKEPLSLNGSEKKTSKNEFLTVIPKILCSEEGRKKQNEHQEVSIECQLCIHRNKAVNWCGTCEKNICRFCKLYHEKVWLVMDHEIQPLRIDELICETINFC